MKTIITLQFFFQFSIDLLETLKKHEIWTVILAKCAKVTSRPFKYFYSQTKKASCEISEKTAIFSQVVKP